MDRNNTLSRYMPLASLLAGVCVVFLLSGCPKKPDPWHNINADSLLQADKSLMDSMNAMPQVTPAVITVDSLRKFLGVTASVPDTTLLRWLRYSTKVTQTVSYSPLLSDPSKQTPTVSAFGGDKVPFYLIHDDPPPSTYSVMPDFSDHEVSNSFNCVSTMYPSNLNMLVGQMGATIYSWTPEGAPGRTYWFAPNRASISGCNPAESSSYVPYMGSENQGLKWKETSETVKGQFIGALNFFAAADRGAAPCYLMIQNLAWGLPSTLPYTGLSYTATTFVDLATGSPIAVVYILTLNE